MKIIAFLLFVMVYSVALVGGDEPLQANQDYLFRRGCLKLGACVVPALTGVVACDYWLKRRYDVGTSDFARNAALAYTVGSFLFTSFGAVSGVEDILQSLENDND